MQIGGRAIIDTFDAQTKKVSEQDLIIEIAKGNENAFETVFKAYYAMLCTYSNSLLKDANEAEEIVQGTFLSLWEAREKLDIHTSLKAYLYRAVHNTSLNRLKHYKVRQMHSAEVKSTNDEAVETTLEQVQGSELELQIAKAIDRLPRQCQAVFRLSRQQGMSYAEIAEQLGVSVKAVDKQIVRALRILREDLRDYLPAILIFFMFKN